MPSLQDRWPHNVGRATRYGTDKKKVSYHSPTLAAG
jgi:hypothetical protein